MSLPIVLSLPWEDYSREQRPWLRLWKLCETVELLTRFCTIVAIGEARALTSIASLPLELRREIWERIKRPTFGDWRTLLALLVDHLCERASPANLVVVIGVQSRFSRGLGDVDAARPLLPARHYCLRPRTGLVPAVTGSRPVRTSDA
jgi:hypothetical protein